MTDNGFFFEKDGFMLRLLPYSEGIVRLTYGKAELFEKADTGIIVTCSLPEKCFGTRDSYKNINTDRLHIEVDPQILSVSYYNTDGDLLSVESSNGRLLEQYGIYKTVGGDQKKRETADGVKSELEGGDREFIRNSNHAYLDVAFDSKETVFGLGSHEEGYANLRGQFVPLYQENMRIALPCFISSKNYAYLFNCASFMTFDDGKIYLDSVDVIDYYFIAADSYDGVCRGYRTLTGITPMLPKWAVGYCQSKERYCTQQEVVDTVKEYRRRGVPLDLIVQDWLYWHNGFWGEKAFDEKRYPEPEKMTREVHELGAHIMLSIWPNMSGGSYDQKELQAAGKMLADGSVYNAFDKDARKIYWSQAYRNLFKHGIDAWWCDSSEPYDIMWQGKERPKIIERMMLSVNDMKKYIDDSQLNVYSLFHSKGIYENQRAVTLEKRVFNMTRSGYSGQHRYGTVVWSGDTAASWETLKRQVHIAQNYIACGEAFWNCDIGAFFPRGGNEWFRSGEYPEGCDDLGYRELYTRWLQFAAFTPLMRSHGTQTPREIWRFGDKGDMFYDAIESAIRLRYTLAPYLYSLNAAVTFSGAMPVCPLALAFPDDDEAPKYSRQYMYGHELLVCPVTKPMYYKHTDEPLDCEKTIEVYLPSGGWYDFYTNEYYDGGKIINVNADIYRIPLFVRAGSIIVTSPVMQYIDEIKNADYNVLVYSGSDGCFTMYDDEGDGYGYEIGKYLMTHISYNDKTGTVSEKSEGDERFGHKLKYKIIGK